jgi:hypothetical protein
MTRIRFALVLAAIALPMLASAQWPDRPVPGIPRGRDGKPVMTAPAPRTADGRPDLSGVWQPVNDPEIKGTNQEPLPRYFISILFGTKREDEPLRAEAREALIQRLRLNGKDDPISHCHPVGVPAINTVPLPFKIILTPRAVVILYEGDTTFRQIFTDGRPLPDDPMPSWMGYSIGRWEADVLKVDTIGLTDKSWLDRMGHVHSDALHVIERFRRHDLGHMDVEVTIDDSKTYTKPIVFTQPLALTPDAELLEYFCTDNEVDSAHFK